MAEFHKLFDNYETYTNELGEFLFGNKNAGDKGCYKYLKSSEGLDDGLKREINDGLKGLKYWNIYKHTNKNAAHSPNLDYILNEFEEMLKNEFKNCKARYNKLAPMLRGKKQQSQTQTAKASEEPINNDRQ